MREKEEFNNVLESLCSGLDTIIDKEIFQELEYKQKLYAISSFLEFIKTGAEIKVLPFEDNKATFILITK